MQRLTLTYSIVLMVLKSSANKETAVILTWRTQLQFKPYTKMC